jgi:RHS repeat-associated protein
VSKLGDLDSYGQDPRRIAYAGSEVDGSSVDYVSKYAQAQQTIKDRYNDFETPYNGKDNDDYVNGGGFCCDDEPKLRAGAIGNGNDNPETFQYYYHSDHLGSTSLITDLDGNIVQHVEYVPFGEVFIEERNNKWNTPYLFNAKELDEETGLYYYGARYYDGRVSLWLSVDPLAEKYPNVSVYAYCFNNSVKLIDPEGKDVVYYDESGTEMGRMRSNERFESYLRVAENTESPANIFRNFRDETDNATNTVFSELSPISGSFKRVTISMSYTGDMSEENSKMSVGTLSINATDNNGNVTTLDSYSADSGPSLLGSIPNGDYIASKIENTSEKGMVRNGVGFKVFLSDNTEKCRDRLRIHPDGIEHIGTAGCIGLTENKDALTNFKNKMQSLFRDGSSVNLNVSIQNNPNYSDCDAKGNKKSKSGAAGN